MPTLTPSPPRLATALAGLQASPALPDVRQVLSAPLTLNRFSDIFQFLYLLSSLWTRPLSIPSWVWINSTRVWAESAHSCFPESDTSIQINFSFVKSYLWIFKAQWRLQRWGSSAVYTDAAVVSVCVYLHSGEMSGQECCLGRWLTSTGRNALFSCQGCKQSSELRSADKRHLSLLKHYFWTCSPIPLGLSLLTGTASLVLRTVIPVSWVLNNVI